VEFSGITSDGDISVGDNNIIFTYGAHHVDMSIDPSGHWNFYHNDGLRLRFDRSYPAWRFDQIVMPHANDTWDLGRSDYKWRYLHVSRVGSFGQYVDADGGYRVDGTEVISSGRAISATGLTIQKYGTLTLTHTASDTVKHSHDASASTSSTSYVKLKTITFPDGLAGNYRVKFDIRVTYDGTGYGRIYKNGSPVGTEQTTTSTVFGTRTEDFSVDLEPGDTLELWGKLVGASSGEVVVVDFRVCYDTTEEWVVESSNS